MVVGTDTSDDSRPALEYAFRLAATRNQPLTVLAFRLDFPWFGRNAGEDQDWKERERLTALLSDLSDKYPDVRVAEKDVEDPEARALVRAASDQDIIVVGSHHEGAVASALGQALAVAVVEHAPTTVVVVPTAPVG